MILFICILLFGNSATETNFDNSVLLVPPWGLDNCDPLPQDCNQTIDDLTCDLMCNESGVCHIKVAIILPGDTHYILSLDEAQDLLEKAVNLSYDLGYIQRSIKFDYKLFDDKCSQEQATASIILAFTGTSCQHVIFGPICDYCLASIGRVAKYIGYGGTPLFTPMGLSFDFTNKKTDFTDEMYQLINSGYADYRSYGEFFHLLMARFDWKKIVLMYDKTQQTEVGGDLSCQLFMKSIMEELKLVSQIDFVDGDLLLIGLNYSDFLKDKVGTKYGLILTCTSQDILREIVLEAQKLKMFELGEYNFFNFELYNNATDPSMPWFVENDERNYLAKEAFKFVYTFTPWNETRFNQIYDETERKGRIYSNGLFDGMLIYTQALNRSLQLNLDGTIMANQTIRGCDLTHNIMGSSFHGRFEDISMNCNAQRVVQYSLKTVSSDGVYTEIGTYSILNKTIENWNVNWPFGVPADTPKCGYDLSKCPTFDTVNILLICLIVVVIAGLIVVGCILYRHFKLKSEIYSMAWKINYNDIMFLPAKPRRNSCSTLASVRSDVDGFSVAGDYRQLYFTVVYYKSIRMAIRNLKNTKIDLSRKELVELKVMKDLSNDNLVKFYGAALDIPNCILTEYCPKGSLQDILENEQVKLDWSFRMSLIMDIVRGMQYLHDSRFVLKISDFGLHFLRAHYEYDDDHFDVNSHSFWKSQLWTAPELLRMESVPPGGTQKGDVYSFAITMHEIITRQGAFYLGDGVKFMEAKEIVDTVRKGPDGNLGQPLRPLIGDTLNEDDVAQLMNRCWAEESADRPDFSDLKNKFRRINKENDGNLLDNLLARMEQYANNLESLVEERTADYLEEKRKCEELLYQLLPKSVAQQLIIGESVVAETFDQVTIYFSDIVGFTALSAQSTPLEVVDLLNDLYTCFDSIIENFDVYKVETIGDAYMVVSGLPVRNGDKHACEIAKMALVLLEKVKKFRIPHRPKEPLQLRIGLHTGPCVAGVVGLKMPRYCLFGDTVNTASRMESSGNALRIHVSPVTKEILDKFGTFDLECRGEVEMKGKGTMTTWWLNGEIKSPPTNKPLALPANKVNRPPGTPCPPRRSFKAPTPNNNCKTLIPKVIQEHRTDDPEVPLLSITTPSDYNSSHA